MEAVSPQTGAMETVVARDQEEYLPYPAALYKTEDGRLVILSRWQLTDEEREAVANGEDLYLGLITDGNPVQPMYIQIGPEGWVQDSITVFVCPTCHEEFESIDATVDHVRSEHA